MNFGCLGIFFRIYLLRMQNNVARITDNEFQNFSEVFLTQELQIHEIPSQLSLRHHCISLNVQVKSVSINKISNFHEKNSRQIKAFKHEECRISRQRIMDVAIEKARSHFNDNRNINSLNISSTSYIILYNPQRVCCFYENIDDTLFNSS